MPDQVLHRKWVFQLNYLFPSSGAGVDIEMPLPSAKHVIFRIDQLYRELSGSLGGVMIRNRYTQHALRIAGAESRRSSTGFRPVHIENGRDRDETSENQNSETDCGFLEPALYH